MRLVVALRPGTRSSDPKSYLHLSHSRAQPFGPPTLVPHDPSGRLSVMHFPNRTRMGRKILIKFQTIRVVG